MGWEQVTYHGNLDLLKWNFNAGMRILDNTCEP
jgi:hypothetical protein